MKSSFSNLPFNKQKKDKVTQEIIDKGTPLKS